MGQAEYAGLAGFFSGMQPMINSYFQDLQNKRDSEEIAKAEAEKSARVDTAKLLSDYAKAGRVAYTQQPLVYENMPTITEQLPSVVPLSQRLTTPQVQTQMPNIGSIFQPQLQTQGPVSYDNGNSMVEQPARQASMSDVQTILRDIYGGKGLPANLEIQASTTPAGMQIIGYWADGTPKYGPIQTPDTTEVPIYYTSPAQQLTISAKTGKPVTEISKGGKVISYTAKDGVGATGGGAEKTIPANQLKALSDMDKAISQLEELQKMMDAKEYKTGIFNPYYNRGIVGNLARSNLQDKDAAKLIATANAFLNSYRKSITGAQAGFAEMGFIESATPTLANDNPIAFQGKAEQTLKELKANKINMINYLKAGGYKLNLPKQQQEASNETEQEGEIMVDAQGNRAIVYPDGSYKEL